MGFIFRLGATPRGDKMSCECSWSEKQIVFPWHFHIFPGMPTKVCAAMKPAKFCDSLQAQFIADSLVALHPRPSLFHPVDIQKLPPSPIQT